jgi:hypothetical protein
MALAAVVAVTLGWTAAAVLPRELEGCLLLIAVLGIEVSLPPSAPGALLPLDGALRLTDVDQAPIGALLPTLQTIAYTTVLGTLGLMLWRRRVRLHPGDTRSTATAPRRVSATANQST